MKYQFTVEFEGEEEQLAALALCHHLGWHNRDTAPEAYKRYFQAYQIGDWVHVVKGSEDFIGRVVELHPYYTQTHYDQASLWNSYGIRRVRGDKVYWIQYLYLAPYQPTERDLVAAAIKELA